MEKRKINKKRVFIAISIIMFTIYILFYGIRFVYFYLKENPIKKNEEGTQIVYLSDKLISNITLDKQENGLFYDNELKEYYFKGKVENNYLFYSGILWRVISIDSANNIKLISDDVLRVLNNKDEDYINEWMKSIKFDKSEELLINTKECKDIIDEVNSIRCKEAKSSDVIEMLSMYEYNRSGGINSFINNENYFWLSTYNKDGYPWYVYKEGGVNYEERSSSKLYGVKAVITLKSNLSVDLGNGLINNPYYIEDDEDGQLKNRNIGEYLSYSDYTWRIIEQSEGKTKVIMDGFIDKSKAFSTKTNEYDLSDKTGVSYYLNNIFYNSLSNDDYIVSGNFDNEELNINKFDYKVKSKSTIEAKVGLPNINDYFVSEYKGIYLINKSSDSTLLIYSINDFGLPFADNYQNELKIRPVIYLDSSLYALSQDGTKYKPYIIGR